MFVYEKRLQYPIRIKNTNPRLASLIISSTAGPTESLARPCGISASGSPCPIRS